MKKILVPVDFEKAAYNAINIALDICSKKGGNVTLLHMLDLKESFLIHESTNNMPNDIFLIEVAKNQFKELIEDLVIPKNVSVSTIIKKEKDMQDLGALADDLDIDLIVMGTEGAHELENWFLETNTQKAIRHSEIPVLCVKAGQKSTFNEVVLVSDFDSEGIEGFSKIAKVIEKMNLRVLPLYVVTPETLQTTDFILEAFNYFKLKISEETEIEWKELQIEIARSIQGGIVNYTRRNKSALISLTTHGFKGVKHLLLGSITESIVNDIEAPVLTVKM